ncbi:expressed unknown protein [Seminavis robusta]|uniref:Uncharacterized protein n=1 Tax=Seminavis robusta TaxID=568900 RepID=A0A9N8EKD4_9STRA|nr:expressed unknown protein [Seminavis robusta]|eukprot:Sro1291_g259930.1 n/a (666) ;mRNA; f:23011-25008
MKLPGVSSSDQFQLAAPNTLLSGSNRRSSVCSVGSSSSNSGMHEETSGKDGKELRIPASLLKLREGSRQQSNADDANPTEDDVGESNPKRSSGVFKMPLPSININPLSLMNFSNHGTTSKQSSSEEEMLNQFFHGGNDDDSVVSDFGGEQKDDNSEQEDDESLKQDDPLKQEDETITTTEPREFTLQRRHSRRASRRSRRNSSNKLLAQGTDDLVNEVKQAISNSKEDRQAKRESVRRSCSARRRASRRTAIDDNAETTDHRGKQNDEESNNAGPQIRRNQSTGNIRLRELRLNGGPPLERNSSGGSLKRRELRKSGPGRSCVSPKRRGSRRIPERESTGALDDDEGSTRSDCKVQTQSGEEEPCMRKVRSIKKPLSKVPRQSSNPDENRTRAMSLIHKASSSIGAYETQLKHSSSYNRLKGAGAKTGKQRGVLRRNHSAHAKIALGYHQKSSAAPRAANAEFQMLKRQGRRKSDLLNVDTNDLMQLLGPLKTGLHKEVGKAEESEDDDDCFLPGQPITPFRSCSNSHSSTQSPDVARECEVQDAEQTHYEEAFNLAETVPRSVAVLQKDPIQTSERTPNTQDSSSQLPEVDTLDDDATPVMTPEQMAIWKCSCGEINEKIYRFCGICREPQMWTCSVCKFEHNKCRFQYCGSCASPRMAQGTGS